MKSIVTDDFRACFAKLPKDVQAKARKNYRLWKENPHHPSLHFKGVSLSEPIFSIRVGKSWRALGLVAKDSDTIYWFWIGSHSEYDKLLAQY